MSTFWRLRKKDYDSVSFELMRILPELGKSGISSDAVNNRLRNTGLEFYYKEKAPVKSIIRYSLPFALIVMAFLLILTPINFMLTGHWGYKYLWLRNWLTQLRLV